MITTVFVDVLAPSGTRPSTVTDVNANVQCCLMSHWSYDVIENWHRDLEKSGDTLHSRHNERDGVSNHQPHDCLPNRLFRRRSKKTSKLRVTALCVGNSPVTDEFPAQVTSNAKMFPLGYVIMNTSDTIWISNKLWSDIRSFIVLRYHLNGLGCK